LSNAWKQRDSKASEALTTGIPIVLILLGSGQIFLILPSIRLDVKKLASVVTIISIFQIVIWAYLLTLLKLDFSDIALGIIAIFELVLD
jgi:hypothetical protein